jgi:hypothetical protein
MFMVCSPYLSVALRYLLAHHVAENNSKDGEDMDETIIYIILLLYCHVRRRGYVSDTQVEGRTVKLHPFSLIAVAVRGADTSGEPPHAQRAGTL